METIRVLEHQVKEIETKYGKASKHGFKTEEGWYSCFENDYNNILEINNMSEIKDGDTFKAFVVENGKYKNLKAETVITIKDAFRKIVELEKRIEKIENQDSFSFGK